MFCLKLPVKITMGKGIGGIYKYEYQNCPYTYQKTTFVIPPRFDFSLHTQCISTYDASVGTNDVASSILDQNSNHHGNTDGKDNDYSQSYETPWKKF